MTRRQWTTPEQSDWLKQHLAAFIDSQASKTTVKEFFPQVIKEWRELWPLAEPTGDEITKAKSVEEAIKKKKSKDDERIKAWFHNHTRGSTSGSGTRGLLKINGQTRFRQEWQVYQTMTYETQWKTVIDNEWDAYQAKWKSDHPGTELPQGRFAFMNSFLKDKYNSESDEVKTAVKERRAAMKIEFDARAKEAGERNAAYQSAIDKLPRTLAVMGESILKQTGWHVTFIVGGPEPRRNGKIMTYMLNCGKTTKDQDYEGFLGEDAYEAHVVAPFDDFLHEAFTPEARLERSLVFKSDTPESTGGEGNVEVKNGNDSNAVDKEAHIDKEGPKKGGKSEYECARETNIARNKELLRQVEEKYPMEPLTKANKKNDKAAEKKAKRKEKVHQEPTRSSARIQGPGSVHDATTTNAAMDESTKDCAAEIETGVVSSTADHVKASPSNHVDASPSALVKPAHDPSNDIGTSPPAISAEPLVKPTPSETSLLIPAQPKVSATHKNTPTPTSTDPLTATSPVSNTLKDSSAPTSTESPPFTALAHAASLPIDSSMRETDRTSQMDVDGNVGDTANTAASPPAWLQNLHMSDYLRGVSKEKAWQELVTSLFMFEALNPTTGNLPTTSRPDEVAAWIKNKKKDSPPEVDADEFGSSFMAWWIAIQPDWRLSNDATFIYDVPNDEDWRLLCKGGSAGLYTVVVALSWWVGALPAEPPSLRAWSAVRDVQWVINQVYKKALSAAQGTKRGRDDGAIGAMQPAKVKRRRWS